MTSHQKLWWRQAQSDYAVFLLLRRNNADPCHQLHYLQMVTEKLAKAYLWGSKSAPPRSHAGFHHFMRKLGTVQPGRRRQQLADLLGFKSYDALKGWISGILPLVYALERLAPALAQDGPNPEYPWPHADPLHAPADYSFPLWTELNTGRGRGLLNVIHAAVESFPVYG